MSNNRFFQLAINQASRLLGKKKRLVFLLARLGHKAQQVNWNDVSAASVKEKFFTMGRLLKAYATGQYRQVPWKTVVLLAAAAIYFVNPADLLPDWFPALGFSDDFSLLVAVYANVISEVEKFLTWEKASGTSIAGN
jgi:uncharacterized membrane protein YkvA (DUF1232 family)